VEEATQMKETPDKINDALTPKESLTLAMREAGFTFAKMGKYFNISGTGVQRYYQRARFKQRKWVRLNSLDHYLLKELSPIIEDIKGLAKK
jgi:hypothetical protein